MKKIRVYKRIALRGMILLFFMSLTTVQAQIAKASLSPRIKVEQQIGLAKLTLDYGRPSKKDRPIFGGLIPYGKVWRTGANASTKLSFDKDVTIAGNKLPAGLYALYTIPGQKEWTIIIHKNAKLWGAGGYDSKDDFIRFKSPVHSLNDRQETLSISTENFHANGGDLIIKWEKTKIVLPVFVDSDALTFKEIEDKIINAEGEIKAATYFDAAQFYYHKNKNLNLAKEWFDKAIALRPNAFWYVYYRAELAYTQKDYKTAKKFVEQSLAMAKKSSSGDYGYIAKCELLIDKINKR